MSAQGAEGRLRKTPNFRDAMQGPQVSTASVDKYVKNWFSSPLNPCCDLISVRCITLEHTGKSLIFNQLNRDSARPPQTHSRHCFADGLCGQLLPGKPHDA
jgi:hypothetical protein